MATKRKRMANELSVRGEHPTCLDQYFTRPEIASNCISSLESIVSSFSIFDMILEPSFGNGAFVKSLREKNIKTSVLKFIDIDACEEVYRMDFLKEFNPPSDFLHQSLNSNQIGGAIRRKSSLTIGNPPFGKNSSLAISFFNRSAVFSDVIAFIVPRTFCKISVQERLDHHFFLVKEDEIVPNSFLFKGESYNVPCVFQVWVHADFIKKISCPGPPVPKGKTRIPIKRETRTIDFDFKTLPQDADFAIRRVGVNAGRVFTEDIQSRSKQSHFFIHVFDHTSTKNVILTIISLDLEKTPSKFNTAGCPSISQHELCVLYNKKN